MLCKSISISTILISIWTSPEGFEWSCHCRSRRQWWWWRGSPPGTGWQYGTCTQAVAAVVSRCWRSHIQKLKKKKNGDRARTRHRLLRRPPPDPRASPSLVSRTPSSFPPFPLSLSRSLPQNSQTHASAVVRSLNTAQSPFPRFRVGPIPIIYLLNQSSIHCPKINKSIINSFDKNKIIINSSTKK